MIDQAIVHFDRALRTLFAPAYSVRPVPGRDAPDLTQDESERRHTAGLMRINHCGEICAQALYQGQAMTCRTESVRRELEQASREETEHLAWTEQRIAELGGRKSLLNPLFYAGSLTLGMVAGKLGDKWNLGFLAETERQVEAHLSDHIERLPDSDERSRAILLQMREDECAHAEMAVRLGAAELPLPVKGAMKVMSKAMTTLTYRI